MRILFAGDKSGGHLLPAVIFSRYAEEEVYIFVPAELPPGLFRGIPARIVGRTSSSRNGFLEFISRFMEALRLILKIRPQVIIGMGGRSTVFPVVWGRILGCKVFLYEPNAVPGRANRFLASFAEMIFCGYATEEFSPRTVKVGVPVRDELVKVEKTAARRSLGLSGNVPVLLCVGGSRGSEFLNNAFKEAVCNLGEEIQVIHITGSKQYSEFSRFYDTINVKHHVEKFCTKMGVVYSAADLVVSRAGAFTLAEVAYFGLPAVLVPHPLAGNHQWYNARYFEERGAAVVLKQDENTGYVLKDTIRSIIVDGRLREQMAARMRRAGFVVGGRKFYEGIRKYF